MPPLPSNMPPNLPPNLPPIPAKPSRPTSQSLVYQVLQDATTDLSAQAIHKQLRENGQRRGLATVYRALRELQLRGVVRAYTLANGEQGFGLCERNSPYFRCLQCGESVPLVVSPMEEFTQTLAEQANFLVYYHTLEFVGVCWPCQDGEPKRG